MRKTLKVDELPYGFIYFTETHIVEGTGKNYNEKVMEHERLCKKTRDDLVIYCRHWEGCSHWKEETKDAVGI